MAFPMADFIEALQDRPEIYNPKHPDYVEKKRTKTKELGDLFGISGEHWQINPILE